MIEEKVSSGQATDDENSSSKDGKERVSYVSKDLKTIIEFVGKVYSQLGHTIYHSNKAIATIHGLSPNSIKMHLSSAQQYKLLELKHGTGYKVTDHFQKIFLPRDDNEKRAAVIESLKNPETYQQLFKDYEYHVVPRDGVKNHFIRNFGFKDDNATRAAEVFLANLKEFELLDSRGVLTSALPSKPIIPKIGEATEGEEVKAENNEPNGSQGRDATVPPSNGFQPPVVIHNNEYTADSRYREHIWIPIHITKSQTAVFAYPKEITENDIKIVEHQLAGILLRIRLENEEKNKGVQTPS
jgi:hypothetical protein